MVRSRTRNKGIEVARGCSISSMTLVDNSSNAGVKTRVISSSINGSMEAEGSISSISGSRRSGALVRLVTPIACGVSLSPLRL